jgi:hypothetical protein
MQQFNLEEWLKDKSRKIVTRDGRIVEILKVDAKGNHPIIGVYQFSDTEDMESSWRIDGRKTENGESSFDLFFADEEKLNSIIDELKSYLEKTPKEQVEKDWKEIQDWYAQHFTNKKHNKEELTEFDYAVLSIISDHNSHTDSIEAFAKRSSKKLLDLARKELERENSEFKPKFTYNEKDYSKLANKLIEFRNNTPLCSVSYRDGEGRKVILHYEKEILDLARKEIEKENPYSGKQEWSEEDENMFKSLNKVLNEASCYSCTEGSDKILNWLKSLKDRVQQPKQEWSEEDEKMWLQIINEMEAIKSNSSTIFEKNIAQDKIDWLKSIKRQLHWKPSGQQIKALKGLLDYNIGVYDYNQFQIVDSLYSDLQKL